MKTLFRIIVVVFVLIIGAAVALYFSLDGIVKSTVQTQATEQLKVPVALGSVDIGLFNGNVGLTDFSLGSPAGFSAPKMLSIASLTVDTGGLMKLRNEPIHILNIDIEGTRLVVEQNGKKFNFKELADQLPSHPENAPPSTTANGKKPVRLIIDTLTMRNGHVLLLENIAGIKKQIDVALPTTALKDIGNADGKQQGVEIKDVATTILSQMVAQASKSAGIPVDVQALLGGNLDGIKAKLTDAAKGQLGGLKIPGDVNGLLKSIGGH